MDIANVWCVDRSRHTMGTDHCKRARYWQYHHNGYGIVPAGQSLNTALGIAVHGLLGDRLAKRGDGMTWLNRLVAMLRGRSDFTISEHVWLAAGLLFAWERAMGKWFTDRFTIEHVEQEFTLEISDNILLMTTPDLICRDKESGKLALLDFKTMSTFGEGTGAQYRDNVQMALATHIVEKALQEPVDTYWILALVKGQYKHFEKDGMKTPEQRYFSHICYAQPPNPPIRSGYDRKGYWYNKVPMWEQGLSCKEWVEQFPIQELEDMCPALGPYQRPTHMLDQCLRGLVAEEKQWMQWLWRLYEGEHVWDVIPPSFGNCTSYYNEQCPYYAMCYGLPVFDGSYVPRRPHHEPEREQMRERGIPVPSEPWEVTSEGEVADGQA